MDEEDLKQLFRDRKTRRSRRGWRCPDDWLLTAYVDGRVDSNARESLEAHLADCDDCLGQVSFLMHSAAVANAEQVPSQLLARAKDLVSEKRRQSTLPGWRWTLAAAAACVLITFAIVLTLRLNRSESPSTEGRLAAQQEPTQTPSAPSLATPPPKNPNIVASSSSPAQPAKALPMPQASTPQVRNVDPDNHAPKLLLPREGAVVKRENLEFRWQSIAEAVFYEVSIVTAAGDPVILRQTDGTRLELSPEAKLISGEKYFVSVRAHLREGRTVRSSVVSFRISD
jgi:Putative zinc-finger